MHSPTGFFGRVGGIGFARSQLMTAVMEVLHFLASPVWWPAYAIFFMLGVIAFFGLRH